MMMMIFGCVMVPIQTHPPSLHPHRQHKHRVDGRHIAVQRHIAARGTVDDEFAFAVFHGSPKQGAMGQDLDGFKNESMGGFTSEICMQTTTRCSDGVNSVGRLTIGEVAMQVNDIIQEALRLPATARFQIVDQLMQSLDKPDPEIDRIWGEEAVRRLASFDAGRSKTFSPEEVFGQD